MRRLNELISFNPLEVRLPTKSVSANGTSTSTGLSPSFPAITHGALGSQKSRLLLLCAPCHPRVGSAQS